MWDFALKERRLEFCRDKFHHELYVDLSQLISLLSTRMRHDYRIRTLGNFGAEFLEVSAMTQAPFCSGAVVLHFL